MSYKDNVGIERADLDGNVTILKTSKILCVDTYAGVRYLSSTWVIDGDVKFIESIGGSIDECTSISFGKKEDNMATNIGFVHNIKSIEINEKNDIITAKLKLDVKIGGDK